MTEEVPPRYLERILLLTGFAAGAVDIISFAKLGGIFASAMTGNLAFLGFYLSRFSFASAVGSAIALFGFVIGGSIGTLLSRGRTRDGALALLLATEFLLLAGAVLLWVPTHHRNGSLSGDGIILLLSVSMGLQSVVGKRVNLSNIPTVVFTSTLTNIVVGLTDMIASRKFVVPDDTRRQFISFSLYFAGALLAGFAVYFQALLLIFLPALAVAWALVSQIRRA